MTSRLILARHAQSVLDSEHRFSGMRDPELSERGGREADALAFNLAMNKDMILDRVFTSSRKAAKKTAEVVMRRFVYRHSLEIADALDERDYADLTGLTHAEARAKLGEAEVSRRAHGRFTEDDPIAVRTVEFYTARLMPALRGGKTVLVVSYDDNLRLLVAFIDSIPIEHEPWRTGMAVDYHFDDTMAVSAKDTLQSWHWD